MLVVTYGHGMNEHLTYFKNFSDHFHRMTQFNCASLAQTLRHRYTGSNPRPVIICQDEAAPSKRRSPSSFPAFTADRLRGVNPWDDFCGSENRRAGGERPRPVPRRPRRVSPPFPGRQLGLSHSNQVSSPLLPLTPGLPRYEGRGTRLTARSCHRRCPFAPAAAVRGKKGKEAAKAAAAIAQPPRMRNPHMT